MKEQDKTPGVSLNEMEIRTYLIEFKTMIVKMLSQLGRRMNGQSENSNK